MRALSRGRNPHQLLPAVVVLGLVLGVASPGLARVWTDPGSILSLEGRGNVLVAATQGGVLVWDLSSGKSKLLTTERGLPSNVVVATALAATEDELLAATTNGLGRGWLEGAWLHTQAQNDERGLSFFSCLARPGSGWIAGGENGRLSSWIRDRIDSLFIPNTRGRVVALSMTRDLPSKASRARTDPGVGSLAGAPPRRLAGAPAFPRGLVAATDNDGLWILLSTGAQTEWRRIGPLQGLPSERTLDVVADDVSNLWVATTRGIARIASDFTVQSWPSDPLLSQRTLSLLAAPDGFVYLGLQDGLARVDASSSEIRAEPVAGPVGPVVGLAWTREGLCWSDGSAVRSIAGRHFDIPDVLARPSCTTLLVEPETVWVGHPGEGLGEGALSQMKRDEWFRFGTEDGLPQTSVHSLLRVGGVLQVGTAQGLYREVGTDPGLYREERLGIGACFVLDERAPFGEVRAQVQHAGRHWIGGSFGLWTTSSSGWQRFDLWPGASEVQDLEAAAETLWAAGGRGGAAFHDGSRWFALYGSGELEGAHFGRVHRVLDGPVLFGTDQGVAQWSQGELRLAPNTPSAFIHTVCTLGDRSVVGTHTGAWIEEPASPWLRLGVLDGLPGARVFALSQGAEGSLWIATSRGLGWLPPGVLRGIPAAPRRGPRRQGTRILSFAPADISARIRIELGPGVPKESYIELVDVAGRRVHRWPLAAGTRVTTWDGRDTRGLPVASGIYYLKWVRSDGKPLGVRRLTWIR